VKTRRDPVRPAPRPGVALGSCEPPPFQQESGAYLFRIVDQRPERQAYRKRLRCTAWPACDPVRHRCLVARRPNAHFPIAHSAKPPVPGSAGLCRIDTIVE